MSIKAQSRTPEKSPSPDRRRQSSVISPSPIPSYMVQGSQPNQKHLRSATYKQHYEQHTKYVGSSVYEVKNARRNQQIPLAILKKKYFTDLQELEDALPKTEKKQPVAPTYSQRRTQPIEQTKNEEKSESLRIQYYEREIENLKNIINDLGNDTSARSRIGVLEKQNQLIRSNYDKMRQAYLILKRQQSVNEEGLKLKDSYDYLLINHKNLQLKLQKIEEENRRLKQQLKEAANKFRQSQIKNSQISLQKQQALESQLKELKTKIQQIKPVVYQSVKKDSQLLAQKQQLGKDLEITKTQLMKSKNRIEILDGQLANAHTTIAAYKSNIQHKNRQLENALAQMTKLKQMFTEMNIEGIEKLTKTSTVSTSESQKIVSENKALKNTIVQLRSQISALKTDSQVLGSHIQLLKSQKESLLVEVQGLKETIGKYLKKETSSASRQIELQLLPEQADPGLEDYEELENLKESLRHFSDQLTKLCEQLKRDLKSLNSLS